MNVARPLRLLTILVVWGMLFSGMPAAAMPAMTHGIDISGWQGDEIDWDAVRNDGAEFVILRAGTSKGKDSQFEANYQAAKAAGLDVGCYFYTYATTAEQVTDDTAVLLDWLAGKQLEYPVYFDIEDTVQQELTTTVRTALCLTFLNQVREAGWCGGVYASKYWFENLLDLATLAAQGEIWWAHWTVSGQPDIDYSEYGLWQYASDGRIDGIYGDIDLNVSFRNYPALMQLNGWNGFPRVGLRGDASGDGRVNTTDARRILQYAAQKIGEDELDLSEADVNEDKKVNTTDARLILQLAAGKIEEFPTVEPSEEDTSPPEEAIPSP